MDLGLHQSDSPLIANSLHIDWSSVPRCSYVCLNFSSLVVRDIINAFDERATNRRCSPLSPSAWVTASDCTVSRGRCCTSVWFRCSCYFCGFVYSDIYSCFPAAVWYITILMVKPRSCLTLRMCDTKVIITTLLLEVEKRKIIASTISKIWIRDKQMLFSLTSNEEAPTQRVVFHIISPKMPKCYVICPLSKCCLYYSRSFSISCQVKRSEAFNKGENSLQWLLPGCWSEWCLNVRWL